MTSASGNGGSQPGSQPGSEDEIIRLLSDPAVFGPVDRVETHVSLVFLGPIYFASIIFARLIMRENKLYQAYGSNMLGAVVGGACEYVSMVMGFKFLLLVTFGIYLTAFLFLQQGGTRRKGVSRPV